MNYEYEVVFKFESNTEPSLQVLREFVCYTNFAGVRHIAQQIAIKENLLKEINLYTRQIEIAATIVLQGVNEIILMALSNRALQNFGVLTN